MTSQPKYKVVQQNSGPFAMRQVCLTSSGRVLYTTDDASDAHKTVQQYVADDRADAAMLD